MTCTEERFLNDVAAHQMQVLRNDGLHRHIRFQQPEHAWLNRFDLITWPGHLCITGDCDTYVFARLADMFAFFRHDGANAAGRPLYINESYWAEKLIASACHGRNPEHIREWDAEDFERRIKERYVRHVREGMSGMPDERKELRDRLEENVLEFSSEQDSAIRAACVFDMHGLRFNDFWEADCTAWSFGFTWCLYAIAWGIRQFDAQFPVQKAEAA